MYKLENGRVKRWQLKKHDTNRFAVAMNSFGVALNCYAVGVRFRRKKRQRTRLESR